MHIAKIIAVPAIALAAGLGLAACGRPSQATGKPQKESWDCHEEAE